MKNNKVDRKPTQKVEPQDTKEQSVATFRTAIIQISWRIAASILILSFAGIWLDNKLDSKPVLSIGGITLSLIVTFVIVRRFVEEAYPGTFGSKK